MSDSDKEEAEPQVGTQDEVTAPGDDGSGEPGTEIDFNTFILSLSTSALFHLGQCPQPDSDSVVNLALAKQTIDCIAILEEKTRGNLSGEEERLIGQVLYDLRMRYVAVAKAE